MKNKIYLFVPHRGSFTDSFKNRKSFYSLDSLYNYLCSSYTGLLSEDIVISNSFYYYSRIGKEMRMVLIKRLGNEDYILLYGCPQCIGYLYEFQF